MQIWKKIFPILLGTMGTHANSTYNASSIVTEAQSAMRFMYVLTFICIKYFWKNTQDMVTVVLWGEPTEYREVGVRGRLIFHCFYFSILFTKKNKEN